MKKLLLVDTYIENTWLFLVVTSLSHGDTTLSQACNNLVIWLLQGCRYQGIETVNRLGQPCYMLA